MNPHAPDAEAAYAGLRASVAASLAAHPERRVHLIGIHSGGAWVAQRLHADLNLETPLGSLSSAFHRDDYGHAGRGLPADMKSTDLPFEIRDAHLLLVDDILFTGRTVRAALNELFDYGRPASVELAVLLDRGGRELPIEAAHVGAVLPLLPERSFVLSQQSDRRFALRIE